MKTIPSQRRRRQHLYASAICAFCLLALSLLLILAVAVNLGKRP